MTLVLYPPFWAALHQVSSAHWFLPAGLRVAMLWITPSRRWGWIAIAEWTGIAGITWIGGAHETAPAQMIGIFLPWLIYAAVIREFRRASVEADRESKPYAISMTLLAGLAGAACNAVLLTALEWLETDTAPNGILLLLSFALGDFAGVVVLAPLIVLVHEHALNPLPAQAYLHRGAVLIPAAGFVASRWPPLGFPDDYRWFLVSAPLFLLGALLGRVAAVVALGVLAIVLIVLSGGIDEGWAPHELQRILTVAGAAALLLGARRDATHEQRERLSQSIAELQYKTRALREAAGRLASQSEAESRKLGLELHDEVGQDMTALATRIHLAERSAPTPEMRQELQRLQKMVSTAHDHLRGLIRQLHPLALERFGLERALAHGPLSEITRDAGIEFACDIQGRAATLPAGVATAVYRICQEAVTNGVKHGCGGEISIQLMIEETGEGTSVELAIFDRAGPISVPRSAGGLGLQGIRDRAHALGGDYRFNPGSGTPRHWLRLLVHPLESSRFGGPAPLPRDAFSAATDREGLDR